MRIQFQKAEHPLVDDVAVPPDLPFVAGDDAEGSQLLDGRSEGGEELALVVHLVDEAGGLVVVQQHGVRVQRAAVGLDGGVVAGVERELAARVQGHLARRRRRRRGGALAHELPRVARVDERVHPAVALEGVEPR